MLKIKKFGSWLLVFSFISAAFAMPTVYPTGTTIYMPDKAWNGYTCFTPAVIPGDTPPTVVVIDMNGHVVKEWDNFGGFPPKILPGGNVLGYKLREGFYTEDVTELNWDGKVVWQFNKFFFNKPMDRWEANQHHDLEREGCPAGYPSPVCNPVKRGKTLILGMKVVTNLKISDINLIDDVIYEVDWDGTVTWKWYPNEHFEELGFDDTAKATIRRYPGIGQMIPGAPPGLDIPIWAERKKGGDWLHINQMATVGPNKWFDAGNKIFHPNNIIWDSRASNILAIIDKKSGKIVWRIGPDYTDLQTIGQIIGPHNAHIVPKGLPGEGNVLVFDNGGAAGYGPPNPGAPTGKNNALRFYSRVIEFNPVTMEKVWEYTAINSGFTGFDFYKFFSYYISSAQRLPNGNTLITEGTDGRIFEVTPKGEIVWEYISPYFDGPNKNFNRVYRAYRIPYQWLPQLSPPPETPVTPPPNGQFRVPGS